MAIWQSNIVLYRNMNESNSISEDNQVKKNISSLNGVPLRTSHQDSTARLRWKKLVKTIRHFNNNNNNSNSAVNSNGINNQENNCLKDNNSVQKLMCSKSKDLSLLELLALKSLKLSSSMTDIISKNHCKNWIQLSGHEGSFFGAGPGTVLKRRAKDGIELRAYQLLMDDPLCDVVPRFIRDIKCNGDYFIEMQDLLYEYKDAVVMDIKMGTRTFLESEVDNNKARKDLYEKMTSIDPDAPTKQEHEEKAVTKLRYMQFREELSSSSNLGFRIEAFTTQDKHVITKELKLVKTHEEVKKYLKIFLLRKNEVCLKLIEKLKQFLIKFENSKFFKSHEVIGSSLLIIHNGKDVGVWMIDFAKTVKLEGISIDHLSPWKIGNHEDGYLFGFKNLIKILEECQMCSDEECR